MAGVVVLSGAAGLTAGLMCRPQVLYPVDTSDPLLESVIKEVRLIHDRLAVLGEQGVNPPSDREPPARQRIDGPSLQEIAAHLRDVKRQLGALNTYIGVGAENMERAALREPSRSATKQLYDAITAGEQGNSKQHYRSEWLLRSTGNVVTRLGRPDWIVSKDGRIKKLGYRLGDDPRHWVYFMIGDGIVTGITKKSP